LFAGVHNRADIEQYRQLLVPRFQNDDGGVPIDISQKIREDFYEALTEFGLCLRSALASRSFFEDASITEQQIATYKRDLKFFGDLRKIARQDAQETIDFSAYEEQIRKLVDRYVIGEKVAEAEGVFLVNELGRKADSIEWSDEKTRNETDIIRSRLKKTIEQELADDPYAQTHFSELLRQAIIDANALFEHPFKQYAFFKDVEEQVHSRRVDGAPRELETSKPASAYFGIMRLVSGDAKVLGAESRENCIKMALDIESAVRTAVAENSLSPQNIEAAIRKALLPMLFGLLGLDDARQVTEQVVTVTRFGLSRSNT
jgi:type I restriction enzyme R subunit